MTAEPTYEALQQRVKELQTDLAKCRRVNEGTFDTKGGTGLLHPDWPEVKWNISGLFAHRQFVHFLIQMMKSLNISHVLDSFHGCPDLLWNGGRLNAKIPFHRDSEKYLRWINDQGIGVFLTFSNLVMDKEHLSDNDSNRLLDYLDEKCGLNGVIVSNDLLSDARHRPGLQARQAGLCGLAHRKNCSFLNWTQASPALDSSMGTSWFPFRNGPFP